MHSTTAAAAFHTSGLGGGGGMHAFGEAGTALEAHGRRAAASAESCLGQLSQLLDAIDLPCDPRRKPYGQERMHAPGADRESPEVSGTWSMYAPNTSSWDGSPDWSPNPGRNPGSFGRRDDNPTPPYVGSGGRAGGASRTPHTARAAHGSSRTQHAQRDNAALPQSGGGGGGDGGDGSGGDAGDHGGGRDSRVTFAGMSLDQVRG